MSVALRKPKQRVDDISGLKVGCLTVISIAGCDNSNATYWNCVCKCGNETIVHRRSLTARDENRKSKSCGCYGWRDSAGHRGSKELSIWRDIIRRCTDQKRREYPRYGGRGIKICDEWKSSFLKFLEDVGQRPSDKHQLERLENDGNYEPGNCVWALSKQQNNNRRNNHILELNGKRATIAQWSDEIGVKQKTIYQRIKRGDSTERALRR